MTHTIHRTTEAYTRLSNAPQIDQRICLSCNWWMRSCSPAHRKCNHCKRDFGGTAMRVGNRIRPVEGIAQADAWQWKREKLETEYSNVLDLDNGGEK